MTMTLIGRPQRPERWVWALPILVALCAAVPYINSFQGPFIYDDINSIRDNPEIRTLLPWGPQSPVATTISGRPVLRLSFALDYAIGGLRVEPYHATNLLIHIGAGLLLYGIVRRNLLRHEFWGDRFANSGPFLAAAVAAVWVTHPLNTEAVTLIVQRAESLAGLFYLAVIYCLIRSEAQSASGKYWCRVAAIVCCALGMATKEMMVTAPLMALLYDRTFLAGSFSKALQRRRQLYAWLAATWLVLAGTVLAAGNRGGSAGFHAGVAIHDYARTQLAVVAHYLYLALWPRELVLDYAWPIAHRWGDVGWGGLLVAVLLIGSIIALWARPWLGFLGAWFFGILLPSSSIMPIVTEVAAEHRMYLPMIAPIALALVGGWALGRRFGLGWLIWAPVAAAIAFGAWFTFQRNSQYGDAVGIWQITVAQRPNNARAHYNLGYSWKKVAEGLPPGTPLQHEAADHALEELRLSLKLDPTNYRTGAELAEVMMLAGDYRNSERTFDMLLKLDPSFAHGHLIRGKLRGLRQDWPDAASDFKVAIAAYPDQPEAHYYLGVCFQQMRQWKQAQAEFERTLALSPGGFKDAQQRLVWARFNQSQK